MPSLTYAFPIIDLQDNTYCTAYNYCETTLSLSKYFNTSQFNTVKTLINNIDLSKLKDRFAGIKNLNFRWSGNDLIIYGYVNQSTYWTLDVGNYYTLDPWWNVTYLSKRQVIIPNNTPLNNIEIPFNLSFNAGCSDYSCIRFTNAAETQELPFWVREYKADSWVYGYVKTSESTVYIYFNNNTPVINAASGKATFRFFEDFDINTVNNSLWTNISSPNYNISGGNLMLMASTLGSQDRVIQGYGNQLTGSMILETLQRQPNSTASSGNQYMGLGLMSGGYLWYTANSLNVYEGIFNTPSYLTSSFNKNGGASTQKDTPNLLLFDRWNILKIKIYGSTNFSFYRNDTLINTSTTNIPSGASNYNVTFFDSTGGGAPAAHYSQYNWVLVRGWLENDTATTSILAENNLTQNATLTYLYINGARSNATVTTGSIINATGIINVTGLALSLYRNGTLFASGMNRIENTSLAIEGLNNFTVIYTGNASFNTSYETWWVLGVNATPSGTSSVGFNVNIDLNSAPLSCLNETHAVRNSTFYNNGSSIPLAEIYACPNGCSNNSCNSEEWLGYLFIAVITIIGILFTYKVSK